MIKIFKYVHTVQPVHQNPENDQLEKEREEMIKYTHTHTPYKDVQYYQYINILIIKRTYCYTDSINYCISTH